MPDPVETNEPRRPRGRPRVEERKVCITFTLLPSDADRLYQHAAVNAEKVSACVRSLLLLKLPPR